MQSLILSLALAGLAGAQTTVVNTPATFGGNGNVTIGTTAVGLGTVISPTGGITTPAIASPSYSGSIPNVSRIPVQNMVGFWWFNGAGANLNAQPSRPDLSPWSVSSVTVVADNATAPDGTTTAATATITNSGGSYLRVSPITVVAATSYVFSFWAKAGTLAVPKASVRDETHAADILAAASYASLLGSGWVRVSIPFTTPTGCVSIGIYPERDGTTTGTLLVWDAELRQISGPAPYAATSTGTVSMDTGLWAYAGWTPGVPINASTKSYLTYAPTSIGGDFTAWAVANPANDGTARAMLSSSDGSGNLPIDLTTNTAGLFYCRVNLSDASLLQAHTQKVAALGTWHMYGCVKRGTSLMLYLDGAAVPVVYDNTSATTTLLAQTSVILGDRPAHTLPLIASLLGAGLNSAPMTDTEMAGLYRSLQVRAAQAAVTLPEAHPGALIYAPPLKNLGLNGVGTLPALGWNPFNYLVNAATETQVKAVADAIVSSGMAAAGYQYVNVDAGWNGSRNAAGVLQVNAGTFPSGMSSLCTYIHGKGLKCGIYSTPGQVSCNATGLGSYQYETLDATTFAGWGVDFLKYDMACVDEYDTAYLVWGSDSIAYAYQYMASALRATNRPIYFSAVAPNAGGWAYKAGLNSWRATSDDAGNWASLNASLDTVPSANSGPGHFQDLDMLEVGHGLTDTEGQTQFSFWSLFSSPLIAGNDTTTQSGTTLATLTNSDVIAVDQDALGKSPVQISQTVCGSATCDLWAKQLSGGACAILMVNRDSSSQNITATFATIAAAVPACGSGPYTTTRDLWAHSSLGTLTTSYTATSVASHGTAMIRVAP
jgi:alpha-galactosidase